MIDPLTFASGSDQFRPVVMWFWNDRIDEYEIPRQLDEFASQRIYEFFIHPLSGIEEDYLSERFFDLIEIAVNHAAKKGMKLWIYDEYNWPSGTAGGSLLREYPEYKMRVVRHRSLEVMQGQKAEMAYPGTFVSAQAINGNLFKDISQEGIWDDSTGRFEWVNSYTEHCTVYVFSEEPQGGVLSSAKLSSASKYDEGYLDTMNPKAVRKFLDMTHEKYAERFEAHFGKTIAGIFTDEVVLTNPFDCGTDTIPWTSGFAELFCEANGYDLLPKLSELVAEVGDYRRTRHDYWHILTERFANAYGKQVADWCMERGMQLTGHCCAEEHLYADLLQSGSTFMFMRYFHIPGIDSIFSKQFLENENFNYAGKMVTGIAEHTGAYRTLSETYTGSGWDMTLEEMKRIFNRLAVLGINFIQFMGAYYSLRGSRKRLPFGYPPSHSFQLPVWRHYGLLSDYISRVCYANTAGTHGAEIAVLVATSTIWSEFPLHNDFFSAMGPHDAKPYVDLTITERTMHGTINALLRIQRDFDLLHEPSLLEAELEGNILSFRGHSYKQLILPSLTVLSDEVWEKLKRFMAAGGDVCFINMLPSHTYDFGSISDEVERLVGKSPGTAYEEVKRRFVSDAELATNVYSKGITTHLVTNELLHDNNEGFRDQLQICLNRNPPLLKLSEPCASIFLLHRKQGDADLFLLVNDEADPYEGVVRILRAGKTKIFNPESGESLEPIVRTVESFEYQEISLRLEGLQALILETSGPDWPEAAHKSMKSVIARTDLNGAWNFAAEGGLNYWQCPLEVRPTGAALRDDQDWQAVMDYRFPLDSSFDLGAAYEARTSFTLLTMPETLELILDADEGDNLLVEINGISLECDRKEYVWDASNQIYRIKPFVKEGFNTMVVRSSIPNWGEEHAPLFALLRGSFGVVGMNKLAEMPRELQVPGNWAEQGFPCFSGTGCYHRTLEISEEELSFNAELRIGACRDAVELWCNSVKIGVSLWNPHQFNITAYLRAGVNELEIRIANTMSNLLDVQTRSGLTGEVSLVFLE